MRVGVVAHRGAMGGRETFGVPTGQTPLGTISPIQAAGGLMATKKHGTVHLALYTIRLKELQIEFCVVVS